MALFSIDPAKCKRDGICVRECPSRVIDWPDRKTPPVPAEEAEAFCIACGHCVAVCPHGAFSLASLPPESCAPLNRDLLPGPEAVKHLLLSRRSVRTFRKKPVPRETLADLLDVARFAPTGSNKQQVSWTVFEDRADLERFAVLVVDFISANLADGLDEVLAQRSERIVASWQRGEDRILRGAPHLIVVHAPADIPFGPTDCLIALTYLELYAYARGLGTCWAGYFTSAANFHPPLTEALGLPPGHLCCGAVMIGYPLYAYARIPERNAPLVSWRPKPSLERLSS